VGVKYHRGAFSNSEGLRKMERIEIIQYNKSQGGKAWKRIYRRGFIQEEKNTGVTWKEVLEARRLIRVLG
jgi:hypothetical protein